MRKTLFFFIFLMAPAFVQASGPSADYEPVNPLAPGAAGRRTPIVEAIEKAGPAVVSVYAQTTVKRQMRDPFHDDFFDRFFGDSWRHRSRPGNSLGSGVIIDGQRGVIVTNEHVIRGADIITVVLNDGRELQAEVLGADQAYDLAIIAVKTKTPLPQLAIGDSESLMIGETVIAIGNPFGLNHTATTGVISATGRTVPGTGKGGGLKNLIQTDASINPGNSGGPLININGDLVGINTAILARGEGLGFAIPAAHVKRISTALLRNGKNDLELDLGLELAEAGRPKKGETGCMIVAVRENGPADKAGLQKGDILMKLDGSSTINLSEYALIVKSLEPGHKAQAQVMRDGSLIMVELTPKQLGIEDGALMAWNFYGLKVNEKKGRLTLEQPAKNSPAAVVGILAGDVLLAFNGEEIKKAADLSRSVLKSRFKDDAVITVQRGRTIYKITLNKH